MNKWLLAIVCTIALIAIVILLAVFGRVNLAEFSTGLAIGLCLLILSVWRWAFKPEIKRLETKEKTDASSVNASKQAVSNLNIEHKEENKSDKISSSYLKSKKLRNSIYLLNENESNKLNFDNTFLDNIYEKALEKALTAYSDCKLSSFSIQVYPFDTRETEDSIVKSWVIINFYFYSKNAQKVFGLHFNEVAGFYQTGPNEDAVNDYERAVFTKIPWTNIHWKEFLNKAFDKVKPLSVSKNTYYSIIAMASDKETPWSITFYDGFNGKKCCFNWNGKGTDERSIDITKSY